MSGEKESFKYFAFISYNSKDAHWGKRLQRKLEHYRMSATLCSEHHWETRTPIRPVFFAPNDIQPGDLSDELKHRLESSLHLIVICSPNSAKSLWVGKEIEYFHSLGRIKNIHFFIVDGDPTSDDVETSCFNPILKQLNLPEILGANIHERNYRLPWLNRERAYIQLITKLLGIDFDVLWKRHRRLRIRQAIACVAALLSVVAAITLAVVKNRPVDVMVHLTEVSPENTSLPPLQNAELAILLDNETKTMNMTDITSECTLPNIPAKLIGKPTRIQFKCDNYQDVDTIMVLGRDLTLGIARDAEVFGHVYFTLFDNKTQSMPNTQVFLDGMEGTTDTNGWVEFRVPIEKQKTVYRVSSVIPLQDTLINAPCSNAAAIFAQ